MRAVRVGQGPAAVVVKPRPDRPPGEVRIRVILAGICSTDLELERGYMGFQGTPGHEFVGQVVDGDEDWLGARVVGEINASCGACPTCSSGDGRHCPRRTVLGILGRDGAHAEETLLPASCLHRVPDGVSDEAAVFVEPLAAAWHVVEQVSVAGKRVAVVGIGKLGHLIAHSVRLAGGDVVGFGRSAPPRAKLEQVGIVTASIDDAEASAFDVVVEATGSPDGLAHALRMVRPLGTIVLKTTSHAPTPVDLAALVIDEVTVVGSRCGRFEPALRLLADGAIDPTPLIDARVALADAADAYRRAASPGALKVLLAP